MHNATQVPRGKVSTADDDAVKRCGNLGQPIVSRQPRPLGRVEAVKISMTLIKRRIQNARSIVGGVLWTTHLEKTFPGRDPGLTEVELVVDDRLARRQAAVVVRRQKLAASRG